MKKIIFFLLNVLLAASVTGQQVTKQDYLNKSKNQKTMAWVLTATGSALIVGGIISYAAESSGSVSYYPGKTVGTALVIGGAAAITGGIILFSASKRNAKKANETAMEFHLQVDNAQIGGYRQVMKIYYPALSVRFYL